MGVEPAQREEVAGQEEQPDAERGEGVGRVRRAGRRVVAALEHGGDERPGERDEAGRCGQQEHGEGAETGIERAGEPGAVLGQAGARQLGGEGGGHRHRQQTDR